MAFDYDKLRKKQEDHGSFWTSYSDLFLMLSTVFLMLYVVASLRSGTFGLQKNSEFQRLTKEAEDLKEQIRVYNALKDEQVAKGSDEEQQVYANLMDKLSLLKEEAKTEKEELRKRAKENEQKEMALNKYQQLIRNIINVNMLAKAQIKRRDEVIQKKEVVIERQGTEIQQLNAEMEEKENVIAENNRRIENIKQELARKIEHLKETQERENSSRKALQRSIAKLKAQSAAQIQKLVSQNRMTAEQLNQVKSTLTAAEEKLSETSENLQKTESQLAEVKTQSQKEREALIGQLQKTKAEYEGEMAALQAANAKRLAEEKAAFERGLAQARLSAGEKARREAEFRKRAEEQARELEGKLADLQGKARASEGKLQAALAEQGRALATVQDLKKENAAMSEDLKRARELAEARKNLAKAIKENFSKAGIEANVDPGTGEVTLTFPDDYFSTGQASLTPGMESRLRKFIPAYTKSLFNDPKTAEKISNVEIVGYASSTYKGKYVNPQSLKEKDREAIDYNLRLSFSRANSIFKYIFDTGRLTYEHQTKLLPMVKVVGRGYLPEGTQGHDIPEGLSEKEFCQRYNCKQAQKVVVKFNLKN